MGKGRRRRKRKEQGSETETEVVVRFIDGSKERGGKVKAEGRGGRGGTHVFL